MIALLLLACRPDTPVLLSASTPSGHPLAIDVAWAEVDADTLWLERTLQGGIVRRDALDPAGGAARALGHPPLSTVSLQLVTGSGLRSELLSVETGNLSPEVPDFTATGEIIPPGQLLLLSTSALFGDDLSDVIVALDHDGEVVWFHAEDSPHIYLSLVG